MDGREASKLVLGREEMDYTVKRNAGHDVDEETTIISEKGMKEARRGHLTW